MQKVKKALAWLPGKQVLLAVEIPQQDSCLIWVHRLPWLPVKQVLLAVEIPQQDNCLIWAHRLPWLPVRS